VRDINYEGARIGREVADRWLAEHPDKPRFIAGSIGPLNVMLSMSSDVNDPGARKVTFDQVYQAYREQVAALYEGGVDLFLIETITDTLNCKAAIKAIMDLRDEGHEELPIWISGTITDRSGRTLSGQTAEAFWNSIKHCKPFAVGFNCALGADLMRPHIAEMARIADTLVAAYPNAGLPNAMGEYDEEHAPAARVGQGGINILGLLRHHPRPHPHDEVRGDAPRHPRAPQGCAWRAWNRSSWLSFMRTSWRHELLARKATAGRRPVVLGARRPGPRRGAAGPRSSRPPARRSARGVDKAKAEDACWCWACTGERRPGNRPDPAPGLRIACEPSSTVELADAEAALAKYGKLVAKPVADGSSYGLIFVNEAADLETLKAAAAREAYVIEPFVAGDEATCGVLEQDGKVFALPPVEIRPADGAFDYVGKYLAKTTEEICPATFAPEINAAMQEAALAHKTVGPAAIRAATSSSPRTARSSWRSTPCRA
jgi:hypothetical protein